MNCVQGELAEDHSWSVTGFCRCAGGSDDETSMAAMRFSYMGNIWLSRHIHRDRHLESDGLCVFELLNQIP